MACFTAQNARQMAAKSHVARRQRLNSAALAGETFPQTPRTDAQESAPDYLRPRLDRTRAQLERLRDNLDGALDKKDPRAVKDYAEALMRLEEIERRLSGRPLVASRKPGPDLAPVAEVPSALDGPPAVEPASESLPVEPSPPVVPAPAPAAPQAATQPAVKPAQKPPQQEAVKPTERPLQPGEELVWLHGIQVRARVHR